jgi:hypothetical protein
MIYRMGQGPISRLAFVFLTLFSPIFGQDLDDVTISGRVTDANGLTIVGATVKATQVETGSQRTIVTNAEGRYRLIELKPGTYRVTVTQSGFGTHERADLVTVSGQNVQLDVQLQPAGIAVSQDVQIDDGALVVDTTRTVVGSTVTEREIEELPNITRNPLDLVLTLGGTSEEALSVRDLAEDRNSNARVPPAEQGNFSLSGGASYSNNITIDGMDNNDDRSARDRFQPPIDAIAEVQVIRNQFSAEYGRASGGRVNLRTRAGTNRFRGRAFMYFRDDNLNANTWYNNSRGFARLPLTEYNPGFWFGGPISIPKIYNGRDRTFFAVAYEHSTLEDTTLIDTYVPVVPNPNFDLPPPTGSQQFCDNANPANCPATAGYVSPYSKLYSTPNVQNSVIGRIDHQLFKGNELTFGFQYGRRKNRRTSGVSTTRIEDALQAKNIDTEAFNITDNQVFGPKVVNQFRFQWSDYTPSYQTDNPLEPVVLIGYRNPVTNSVQTLIAGNSTASTLQNFSDSRKETRYQVQDSVAWIAGNHTVRFGFDVQNVNSTSIALSDATGTYNFGSVLNYSNNVLSRYRQNFGTTSDVDNTYWGLFVNDEFRLRPNLTFSFGLRYERETVLEDTNNFGPRAAIAWDPFKDGKTVVRAGAGVFYNRTLLRTVGDFIQNSLEGLEPFDSNTITTTNNARNNVLAAIAQSFPSAFATSDELRAVIATANCGPANAPVACSPNTGFVLNTGTSGNPLRSIEPGLRIPEAYNFNVGFERELGAGLLFEANYTYNRTAHLWREYNINVPVLPAGYDDLTDYLLDATYTFTNANNTVRTYRFWLGPTNDASGLATNISNPGSPTGTCGTTSNVTCWVNLNTLNSSTTAPNTNLGDGVSSNSIGGPIGIAREAVRSLRPNPNFDEMARVASLGNARYHGLVLELRSRSRKLPYGFRSTMRAVYTLSKMEDDGLNNTSNAEVNDDFGREWARSLQDRRHRFVFAGTLNTPWWMGKLQVSPIFRYGSSAPFNLGYGVDRNLNDQSTDRVIFNGNLRDLVWREPGSPTANELLSQFQLQPIGARSGNLPRNIGIGPSQYIFDMNISREWRFTERFRLRGNVEMGNLLNMAVFSFGSEFVDFIGPNASEATRKGFLVPTRTYRAREIRFGLRFDF